MWSIMKLSYLKETHTWWWKGETRFIGRLSHHHSIITLWQKKCLGVKIHIWCFFKFSIQKKAPKTMLNFGAKNRIGDAELWNHREYMFEFSRQNVLRAQCDTDWDLDKRSIIPDRLSIFQVTFLSFFFYILQKYFLVHKNDQKGPKWLKRTQNISSNF